MALTLFTAPAGSGKTQWIIERIRAQCETSKLPRILVIVPSRNQQSAFLERLVQLPHPVFGVRLLDFSTLYHDILDTAGALPRLVPESTRYRLIRHIIRKLAAEERLPYFAPIADKPGLYNAVARFTGDLEQNLTQPADFQALASTPRLSDLAAIYTKYLDLLQTHGLSDHPYMGALSRAALQSKPRLYADWDYAAADGFDEFHPAERAHLELLAERVPTVDVTLTLEPGRLAHSRFERTFAQFTSGGRIVLSARAPHRTAPLEHLERNLFVPNAPRANPRDSIVITSAPSREREVRAIGRTCKRLLREGVPPAQMIVLFRQLTEYQSLVREIFDEFGIPVRVRQGMPLGTNPLISALLNLLSLSTNAFLWRDTLDALHSPYFSHQTITPADVADIERITREAVVVEGLDTWLAAFVKPEAPLREDEDDERRVAELSREEIVALRNKVAAFSLRVTPPARGAPRAFIDFIEGLIGPDPAQEEWQEDHHLTQFHKNMDSLWVIKCARGSKHENGDVVPGELVARDIAALVQFKNVLRGLVDAEDILREPETEWSAFLSDLQDAIHSATYDLIPTTEGHVVVASVSQARGIAREYVFLGGLVESEFPPRAPQDPLLTAAERDILSAGGVPLVSLQARDEMTLFYDATTLARTRLYLSFPYLDDAANPLYPSPYIRSVTDLFDGLGILREPQNNPIPPEQAASPSELALALTHTPVPELDRALQEASAAWRHSLRARRIEGERESLNVCDDYSGVMVDAALRAECAQKFGAGHTWSASQFNEWGSCGFRFFAHRLLHLEATEDPEKGLDPLQLGSLYHKILEDTYRVFISRKMAVTPTTLPDALAILHSVAEPLLVSAPTCYAFRQNAWWKQECGEMLRCLDALLTAESARNGENAPVPIECEIAFGREPAPPLKVELTAGTIRIQGKIDRMDQARDGVVLIDYKTGSTPIGIQQVIQGHNLQLPVYVLAAQAQGYRVANAFYLHIRNGDQSGEIKMDREDWLAQARDHMDRFVTGARAGEFAVVPTQYEESGCAGYCDFAALCRVGRWSKHKGRARRDA